MIDLSEIVKNSAGLELKNGSKIQALYEGFRKGFFKSDSDAKLAIFGSEDCTHYYSELKATLLDKIVDAAIVNRTEGSESQIALRRASKYYLAALYFFSKDDRPAGIELAKKSTGIARKYSFAHINFLANNELAHHYGAIQGNTRNFSVHLKEAKASFDVLQAETMARLSYLEVAHKHANSRSLKNSLLPLIDEKVKYLESIPQADTFPFIAYFYNIQAYKYSIIRDFIGLVKMCDEALLRLHHIKAKPYVAYFTFKVKKLMAFISLAEYALAQKELGDCLRLAPPGSYNWVLALVYQAILGFHSNQPELVEEAIAQAKKFYPKLPTNVKDQWLVIEAFLNFLKGGHIKIGKLINQVDLFSRDKQGANIPVIILEILSLIRSGKKGTLIDKAEAYKQYSHRNLRGEATFRSNQFMKMLLQVPAGRFKRDVVERRAKQYQAKLLSHGVEAIEVEMVPYEVLWGKVLEMLK